MYATKFDNVWKSSSRPRAGRRYKMRWFSSFAALNAGFFAAILFVVWPAGGFADGLGVVLTMALATGLMGLVFYRNRRDVDGSVYQTHAVDAPRRNDRRPFA
jgi:hypothetical protein